jgi:hypothetical protein
VKPGLIDETAEGPLFIHKIEDLPPLRDYAEDVPDLLKHYVDRIVKPKGWRCWVHGRPSNHMRSYAESSSDSSSCLRVAVASDRRKLRICGPDSVRIRPLW